MARNTLGKLMAFICALLSIEAAAEAPVPPYAAPVVDTVSLLSPLQKTALERKLREFKPRAQIGVLIVASTRPETIEQYGIRVAEAWRLGRKKIDDGAIVIIARDDRKVRIEVGYGLEGSLSDAITRRIVSDIMVPSFKQNDFAGGINAGIEAMFRAVSRDAPAAADPAEPGWSWPWVVFALLLGLAGSFVVGRIVLLFASPRPAALISSGCSGLWCFGSGSLLFSPAASLGFGALIAVLWFVFTLRAYSRVGSRRAPDAAFSPLAESYPLAEMTTTDGIETSGDSDSSDSGGGGDFGGGGASDSW